VAGWNFILRTYNKSFHGVCLNGEGWTVGHIARM